MGSERRAMIAKLRALSKVTLGLPPAIAAARCGKRGRPSGADWYPSLAFFTAQIIARQAPHRC
jgi:hypothetical protein